MGKYAKLRIQSFLILGLLCVKGTYGFSRGAPATVCGTMTPVHGVEAQTTDPPYEVEMANTSVNAEEEVEVTIKGKTDTDLFKGFLILARDPDDDKVTIGEWKDGENSQTVTCGGGITGMAVTHKDGTEKNNVKVVWKAPKESGQFEIFFTVVKDKQTFWNMKQTEEFKTIEVTGEATKNVLHLLPVN